MSTLKGKSIASGYKNILQSSSEITNSNLKRVETGAGVTTSMKLSTTSAEFQKVGIGTSGVVPDGSLHVMSVSAGAVSASSSANEVVLENVGSCGMSILSGAAGAGNILFGDTNDNDVGKVSYDHSTDSLQFSTNGVVSMTLDKSSNLNVAGTISQSDDRYELKENFEKVPSLESAAITQSVDATTAVTLHAKYGIITMQSHDLAATDTVEFTFNNHHIFGTSSHVHVQLHEWVTDDDNAMVNVLVYDVADGVCKIRIGTNGTDVTSQAFKLSFIVDPYITPNQNFVVSGINGGSSSQYSGNIGRSTSGFAGIKISTNTTDNDRTVVSPRNGTTELNAGNDSSGWAGVPFGTENKIDFSSAVSSSGVITDTSFWAGLKLTEVGVYATDADQAYFLYSTDDTDIGALTTNGNLHFIYSVGGVDYITDLGIAVAVNTVYRLRIVFDENRQVSAYVNNIRYGLTTATTAGGVTQSVSTTKSLAMTDNIDLLPFIGVQTHTSASKGIQCGYIKLSRDLYE